ncbi:hypothetical protein BDV11DRAFT_158063 [Aspergillus similis]
MEILLDNKVTVDVPGPGRRPPLSCAAAVGGLSETKLLPKKKATSQCADEAGMIALHWAV